MKNLLSALLFVGLLGAVVWTAQKKVVKLMDVSRGEWTQVEEEHEGRERLIPPLAELLRVDETLAEPLSRMENAANVVRDIRGSFGGKSDYSILTSVSYARAQEQLGASVSALLGTVGASPRWSADGTFIDLKKRMVEANDRVSSFYAKFNQSVREYNQHLEAFPSSLYAEHLGFSKLVYLNGDLEARGLTASTGSLSTSQAPPPAQPPAAPANRVELRLKQANANGLLVMILGNGREAGTLSRISAIAIPDDGRLPADIGFNQEIGESMTKALSEMTKFMKVRHGGWPIGHRLEFGFANKYTFKDGPSAAVATALILDSLITGRPNDDQLAVTGDMNSDGQVQPVGGVVAKIRGATNGHCSLVGVPARNAIALTDLLVLDGGGPFVGIQVFTLQTFDDALMLSSPEKPAALKEAIEDFAKIQELMKRDRSQVQSWLRNKFVLEKLQKVVQNAPNHASAKLLLTLASGRAPSTLSLAGSFEGVELAANDLVAAIKAGAPDNDQLIRNDALADSILKLKAMRSQLDARIRSYSDSLVGLGEVVREWQKNPPRSPSRSREMSHKINGALRLAVVEREALANNPTIIEELER